MTVQYRFTDMIAMSVETTFHRILPAAVFVPTRSGYTAQSITRFRLPVWIMGVSSHGGDLPEASVFLRRVSGVRRGSPGELESLYHEWLQEHGIEGELAILTEGPSVKFPHTNNRMEIIDLKNK